MWETPYYLAVKKVIRFKRLDAAVKINETENPGYILIDNAFFYVMDKLS
jgi:hypothetical protein